MIETFLTKIMAVSWFGIESPFESSLTTGDAIIDRIFTIINIIGTAGGLVAVIFIIYAGFLYVTSAGDEDKVKQAQGIITGSVIGLVIIILSSMIIRFVIGKVLGTS